MSVPKYRAQPVVAHAEQHAHAFRRREGQVEARHTPAEDATERLTSRGMLAAERPLQRLLADPSFQPERSGPSAEPLPVGLRTTEVVVLHTRAHSPGTRH
jgi:hypothetical protein